MQSIKDWLKTPDVLEMQKNPVGKNMSSNFFRDPMRHVLYDPDLLYAPADGIVLYAIPKADPNDLIEIKGKDFSLKEMLNDEQYDQPSLVVGIFMTSFDVHVNRAPTDGYYLEVRETNTIYTHNISMLMVENELLTTLGYKKDDMGYMHSNERKISVFYSPPLDGRYYIVQIGDKDIDVINNWGLGEFLTQGERMGVVRWGSQVDLVIPLKDKKFEIMVDKLMHVEAGIDPIARIV